MRANGPHKEKPGRKPRLSNGPVEPREGSVGCVGEGAAADEQELAGFEHELVELDRGLNVLVDVFLLHVNLHSYLDFASERTDLALDKHLAGDTSAAAVARPRDEAEVRRVLVACPRPSRQSGHGASALSSRFARAVG